MGDYWKENGIEKPQEVVVCAANRHPSGFIICGARHWDSLMHEQADGSPYINWGGCDEGFINQFGEFLTREEALDVVKKSGQPFNQDRNVSKSELFSEGLY